MARILVAEDERQLANLYELMPKKQGHEIIGIASSGSKVVEIFRRANPRPDLVILDHRLDKMSGLEALKELLQIDPKAKILFASADDSVMEDVMNSGAIDFIGKPFSMQELVEVITSCLA